MKFWFKILLVGIVALPLAGCATVYNPATGRQEFIFVTTPMEVSIGRGVAAKIKKESKFVDEPQKVKRVGEIGQRIAAVSDRTDLKYRFNIIDDKDVNAFTSPGGYVYINSGLLEKADDNELACVIGHEVGHVAARHIAKKMQAQIGYQILMDIAARKADIKDVQTAVSITYDLIARGYSREDELLADRLGVKYAYKAGYDPYAMISFLKKMKELDKGPKGLIFLRTHPYPEQRIQQLESQIPLIISNSGEKDSQNTQEDIRTEKEQPEVSTSSISSTTDKSSTPDKPKDMPRHKPKDKPEPRRVMCPKCRKIFSGQTNYCPYDGTKLK